MLIQQIIVLSNRSTSNIWSALPGDVENRNLKVLSWNSDFSNLGSPGELKLILFYFFLWLSSPHSRASRPLRLPYIFLSLTLSIASRKRLVLKKNNDFCGSYEVLWQQDKTAFAVGSRYFWIYLRFESARSSYFDVLLHYTRLPD